MRCHCYRRRLPQLLLTRATLFYAKLAAANLLGRLDAETDDTRRPYPVGLEMNGGVLAAMAERGAWVAVVVGDMWLGLGDGPACEL